MHRAKTRSRPASVFSHETDSTSIWLADNSGNKGSSTGFARDVQIVGWTSVGDKLGGAYIVYDCAILTKEGTVIHTHKRYSAFAQLYAKLRVTLPPVQQPPTAPRISSNPFLRELELPMIVHHPFNDFVRRCFVSRASTSSSWRGRCGG